MPGQTTWDDVRDVLNRAATQLGLPGGNTEFPLESTDANMQQLGSFMGSAGRTLVRKYDWPQLRKPYAFNTLNGVASYGLPPDVLRIIDNTVWAPGTNQPLVGPLSPADWQALLRRGVASATVPFFRVDMPSITFLPTPASARNVTLEYQSRYWIYGVDDGDISRDLPSTSDDHVWLDAPLITAATKLMWLQAKSFPTDAVQAEYDAALDNALAVSNTASALVIGRPRSDMLIGVRNLPDSGWGFR